MALLTTDHSEAELRAAGHHALLGPIDGVTLVSYFVDEFGREFTCRHAMSLTEEQFAAKADLFRAAAERFYSELGCQLLSLQREIQTEPVIISRLDETPTPVRHLRLVAAAGRRVMSEDARVLMQSAGLDEAAVRQSIYGELP